MTPFFDNVRKVLRVGNPTLPPDQPVSPDTGRKIFFGGMDIPESEATGHFLFLGSTGSGKTINQRLLMQSVLPTIGEGLDSRALVYDAKQDAMSVIHGMCPDTLIRTTNPFDARGVAWDMCADTREPRVAVELVFTLFPREHESQPFFSDAVRLLAYNTIISFILSGDEWTFADLLRVLSSSRRLKAILRRHPETRDIVPQFFHDAKLLSNIESTIGTKIMVYAPVAAAWEAASENYSLEDWITEESVLILGNSEISRTAIDALNRCIFKRTSDLTLHLSESFTRRNWFFIDELSEAGRLDGLVSLLKKARSKGGCVSIAAQGIAALRDERLYGQHMTTELLAQIGNRFFGRIECPDTADYASRCIGDQEVDQTTISQTFAQQGSTTHNHQIVTRRSVLPSELMGILPCTRENGLSGYFLVRSAGCYFTTLSGPELFDEALIPPSPNVKDFVARPIDAQFLRPWTKEQAAKFGVISRKPRPDKRDGQDGIDPLDNLDDLES